MTEYAILKYMIDYFEIYTYIWLRRNCVVFDTTLVNTDTCADKWTTEHKDYYTQKHEYKHDM